MDAEAAGRPERTPEERARRKAKYLSGLLWHAGVFLIINGLFWILDLGVGDGGFDWALWITGAWGLALAFHVLAWFIDGRQIQERKALEYLAEEQTRRPGSK
mgnify:CR=1 FL=1